MFGGINKTRFRPCCGGRSYNMRKIWNFILAPPASFIRCLGNCRFFAPGYFAGPPGYMATSAIEYFTAASKVRANDQSQTVKTTAVLGKYLKVIIHSFIHSLIHSLNTLSLSLSHSLRLSLSLSLSLALSLSLSYLSPIILKHCRRNHLYNMSPFMD